MRRTPSSTEAEEVARIGRTPMAAAAAATLTTSPETLLSTNAGEPTRPTITSFWTRYGHNKIFGSGNSNCLYSQSEELMYFDIINVCCSSMS